jgi:hypothetical protein
MGPALEQEQAWNQASKQAFCNNPTRGGDTIKSCMTIYVTRSHISSDVTT